MNKLTIVPIDSTIYVDSEALFNFDLSIVPSDIHALQWHNGKGHIERKGEADEIINTLPDWANQCLEMWITKKKSL